MKLFTSLMLSLVCFSSFGQAPIASYPFNGNSNDATGNGHNGTNYNVTLANDRFGMANSAYSFNGIDSYIDIGNTFTFTSYTFSAWINLNVYPTDFMVIISSIQNGLYGGYGTEFRVQGDSTADFAIGNGLTYFGSPNAWTFPTFTLDSWNHVVFKYDHSITSAYIYLNTVLLDSVFVPGGYQAIASNPFFIGARPSFGDEFTPPDTTWFFMKGLIDDIDIYDRPLTSQEIDSLYNYKPSTFVSEINTGISSIFPNPANNWLNVKSNQPIESITVSDIRGVNFMVVNKLMTNQARVNIADLPKGIYIIKVNNEAHKVIID